MRDNKKDNRLRKAWLLPVLLLISILLCAGCGDRQPSSDIKGVESPENRSAQTEENPENRDGQTEENPESRVGQNGTGPESAGDTAQAETALSEDGQYSTRDEVALYLHLYEHLPDNYITKEEARKLGWDNSAGNLWDVAPGMSIGGDRFGNYEGLLPEEDGRTWKECDVGYEGGYRGAERVLYSNDGLIYYTNDHYETFTCLYD